MLIETRTIYRVRCDFCGQEFTEENGIPVMVSLSYTLTQPGREPGDIVVSLKAGHMCPDCLGRLQDMERCRILEEKATWCVKTECLCPEEASDDGKEEPKAGESQEEIPGPGPGQPMKKEDNRTCSSCMHCEGKTGHGRGMQYKCGLSGAWFLAGLGCDTWRDR